jgi:glycine cleavage system aminomethyltransferase T
VIAHIRTYGQVAKSLRSLRLQGFKEPPPKGTKLYQRSAIVSACAMTEPASSPSSPQTCGGEGQGEEVPNKSQGEKEVGVITRAAWPPKLRTVVAQGYVRKEVNQTGAKSQLDVAGQKCEAEIVDCR